MSGPPPPPRNRRRRPHPHIKQTDEKPSNNNRNSHHTSITNHKSNFSSEDDSFNQDSYNANNSNYNNINSYVKSPRISNHKDENYFFDDPNYTPNKTNSATSYKKDQYEAETLKKSASVGSGYNVR